MVTRAGEILRELVTAGVSAAVLIELAAEAGAVAPRVIGREPADVAPPALDFDAFAQLAGHPAWQEGDGAWPSVGAGDVSTFVAPLRVEPPIARVDTLLLVRAARSPDVERSVASVSERLERLLSERRKAMLGALLLTAVDQAADAIEVTDRAARIAYVNRAWQRIFGYSSAEALGRYASELIRERARPVHESSFYRFTEARVTAGKPWLGVLTSSKRDGLPHLNEVTVSPFESEPLGFRGNFVVRRDVAHRAERDAALLSAHTEFRGVLSAIPDGVTVLRDDLVYYANPAFLKLIDGEDRAVVGRPFLDLIVPDDREAFRQRAASATAVVRMKSGEGRSRLAEISTAGAISFEGSPATIHVIRDITERRISEEQLARAERLSALGEMAAGVAHELNNPMAYVVMNLELLRAQLDERKDGKLDEALNEALDGVRRMREIVVELGAFTRSGESSTVETVDVKRAITSALNIAQNQIRHRAGVQRELEEHLSIAAREGQLVQVLVNLLVNAAQAIPEGDDSNHRITVRARSLPGERVELSVSDTGPGIPAEILPHLFHFFATTKGARHGSGLGLAISRRIVERFGGEIRAENLPDRGAAVTVVLPRGGPATAPAVVKPADPPRQAERLRVLVIDDEPAIGRALRRVLATHDVTVISDGHEATALLLKDDFDVVVCDLMMPGISGHKLFAVVCEKKPALRSQFLFISGGAVTDEAARFVETSGCQTLAKPFSNAVLLTAVERVGHARS